MTNVIDSARRHGPPQPPPTCAAAGPAAGRTPGRRAVLWQVFAGRARRRRAVLGHVQRRRRCSPTRSGSRPSRSPPPTCTALDVRTRPGSVRIVATDGDTDRGAAPRSATACARRASAARSSTACSSCTARARSIGSDWCRVDYEVASARATLAAHGRTPTTGRIDVTGLDRAPSTSTATTARSSSTDDRAGRLRPSTDNGRIEGTALRSATVDRRHRQRPGDAEFAVAADDGRGDVRQRVGRGRRARRRRGLRVDMRPTTAARTPSSPRRPRPAPARSRMPDRQRQRHRPHRRPDRLALHSANRPASGRFSVQIRCQSVGGGDGDADGPVDGGVLLVEVGAARPRCAGR